ncbi:MAG: DUF3990 domain-containing protein [Bacteroidaceae bacterium]|nr:DUF3990 domain-containing protein [Bacteroidaceae bacterium]
MIDQSNIQSLGPDIIDIYHGSDHIIEQPIFRAGKTYNDYGRGFYCTEHAELAKEWACSADSDGYANHYQLDRSGLSVLNLNAPEYNILNWLAILLENRKFNVADGLPQRARTYLLENFKVEYKKYDIIIGYRANDSYFSYAGDFVNGTLSLSDLSEAMRLGKLGEQVVLKSKKAFEALAFMEAIKAPRQEYFAKYKSRDEEARTKYRQIASKPIAENEIYVLDIIRNNWKNGQGI